MLVVGIPGAGTASGSVSSGLPNGRRQLHRGRGPVAEVPAVVDPQVAVAVAVLVAPAREDGDR